MDHSGSTQLTDATLVNKRRECEIRVRIARVDEHPVDAHGRPLLFVDDTSECPVCREAFETVAVYKCGHFLCGPCHERIRHGDVDFVSDPNHCIVCKERTPFGDVVLHTFSTRRHASSASFADRMERASRWTPAPGVPPVDSVAGRDARGSPGHSVRVGRIQHPDDPRASALMLEIVAPEPAPAVDAPAVMHFLIDGSGSMEAFLDRQHAERTFDRLAQRLVGCFVSCSVFSDDASTLVEPVFVDAENAATIGQTLHTRIRAHGRTALHRGLRHLREQLIPAMTRLLHGTGAATATAAVDVEHWVVIVTDGVADDTLGAADELRRLEATCVPFVLGVGENYSFDYCDRLVRRDTTKYAHVADESTLVDHLAARPRLQRFAVEATADESTLYYNGNVHPHADGRHEFVLKWLGDEPATPTRLVLTNVDVATLTCNRARVDAQPDAQLAFALRPMMHVTIALAHVKDLCFNVAASDRYGTIHELLHVKKMLRTYGVGMGASYADLLHLIETQVSEFTRMLADRAADDPIGRCHSSNTAARLASSTARRAHTVPCGRS